MAAPWSLTSSANSHRHPPPPLSFSPLTFLRRRAPSGVTRLVLDAKSQQFLAPSREFNFSCSYGEKVVAPARKLVRENISSRIYLKASHSLCSRCFWCECVAEGKRSESRRRWAASVCHAPLARWPATGTRWTRRASRTSSPFERPASTLHGSASRAPFHVLVNTTSWSANDGCIRGSTRSRCAAFSNRFVSPRKKRGMPVYGIRA